MASKAPDSATEEEGSTPAPQGSADESKEAPRDFLRSARRNLSEDEAASPAGRRWLIAEVERLDRECEDYKKLSKEHSDLRVEFARLAESQKKSKWLEISSSVMLSTGSAGLGAASSYMAVAALKEVGWVFLVASGILVFVGILARALK